MQFSVKGETSKTAQTTPLLTACQSCRSPPLDPDPPQALLLEQSPHCVCLLWGVSLGERWAASTVATIGATWASRGFCFFFLGREGGGVGRLSGGWNEWRMGCVWEPCPRPACPLVKRASALPICNADLSSCRLTLGKGASMAGIKQSSADGKCHSHFDSWPPFFFFFFANLDLLLSEKKPLPPYCVLQSQPALGSWIATLDSKEKKKTKFRAPIHIGGSNCHSHWGGVKYAGIRMREKEHWKFPLLFDEKRALLTIAVIIVTL